jgi:hypothetical protein
MSVQNNRHVASVKCFYAHVVMEMKLGSEQALPPLIKIPPDNLKTKSDAIALLSNTFVAESTAKIQQTAQRSDREPILSCLMVAMHLSRTCIGGKRDEGVDP